MNKNIKFKCVAYDTAEETEKWLNKLYSTYKIDKIQYLDIDLIRHPKKYTIKIIFTIFEE